MNIAGIGIDLIEINKIKKIMSGKTAKRFLENTFTKNEIKCAGKNILKYATNFAAKEAVYKAFRTGWIEGKDVEVIREKESGAPTIKLHGKIASIAEHMKIKKILVSLSSTDSIATAVVILISS